MFSKHLKNKTKTMFSFGVHFQIFTNLDIKTLAGDSFGQILDAEAEITLILIKSLLHQTEYNFQNNRFAVKF